jgi:hypothetical protein
MPVSAANDRLSRYEAVRPAAISVAVRCNRAEALAHYESSEPGPEGSKMKITGGEDISSSISVVPAREMRLSQFGQSPI